MNLEVEKIRDFSVYEHCAVHYEGRGSKSHDEDFDDVHL